MYTLGNQNITYAAKHHRIYVLEGLDYIAICNLYPFGWLKYSHNDGHLSPTLLFTKWRIAWRSKINIYKFQIIFTVQCTDVVYMNSSMLISVYIISCYSFLCYIFYYFLRSLTGKCTPTVFPSYCRSSSFIV